MPLPGTYCMLLSLKWQVSQGTQHASMANPVTIIKWKKVRNNWRMKDQVKWKYYILLQYHTLIKKKTKFNHRHWNSYGIGCKDRWEEGLLNICNRSLLNFLIYEENLIFFFISVTDHFPAELTNRFPLLLRQREEAFSHPSLICRTCSIQKIKGSPISFFFKSYHNCNFLQSVGWKWHWFIVSEPSCGLLFPHSTQDVHAIPWHFSMVCYTDKKKRKFSSKFRMEQLQSHIWGRAS